MSGVGGPYRTPAPPPMPVPLSGREGDRMGEGYLLVSEAKHRCAPPGWWDRRGSKVRYGSKWCCDCGKHWEFHRDESSMLCIGEWRQLIL